MLLTPSAEATTAAGAALAAHLAAGDVIGLTGELGSGKTTFARGVIRALGVADAVPSPSFILIREYAGRLPVFHLDLYRLEEERELLKIGVPDHLAGDGVALVEWCERLGSLAPRDRLVVAFGAAPGEGERRLEFRGEGGAWAGRLARAWPAIAAAARAAAGARASGAPAS